MAYEKQYTIADAIIEKTHLGELNWEKTFNDDNFEVKLKKTYIRISYQIDFDGEETYAISILDKLGAVLERFTCWDLDADKYNFRPNSYVDYSKEFRVLYNLIRRKALGIEQVLDEVIANLNE